MKRLFSKLPYGIILMLLTSLFSNTMEAQVIDCSTTDCTCDLTFEVTNATGEFILELAPTATFDACPEITAEGTYTVTIDAQNAGAAINYILAYTPLGGSSIDLVLEGCGISFSGNLNAGNSVFFFDVNEPCDPPACIETVDCSATDCTCEAIVTVENLGSGPFLGVAMGGNVTGSCNQMFEEGDYCYTLDLNNGGSPVTYGFLALSGGHVGVSITGCGVDLQFELGNGNPSFQFFDVFDPNCEEIPCFPIDAGCEGVSFEYCCDGTLTTTFTGPITYVKYHNTNTWSNDWICSPWNNNDPCTGTIQTYLDPAESWGLEVNGGGCSAGEVIFFEIDCSGFVEEGGERSNLGAHNDWYKEYLVDVINIYPNPAKDFITIENVIGANQQVEMLNASGQKVIVSSLKEGSSNIDISGAVPGVYFLRVNDVTTGAVIHTEKIVVLK